MCKGWVLFTFIYQITLKNAVTQLQLRLERCTDLDLQFYRFTIFEVYFHMFLRVTFYLINLSLGFTPFSQVINWAWWPDLAMFQPLAHFWMPIATFWKDGEACRNGNILYWLLMQNFFTFSPKESVSKHGLL